MSALHCAIYLLCTGVFFFLFGRVLPKELISYDTPLFRERKWERKLYQFLKVPVWQAKVPDMSRLMRMLMPAKNLKGQVTNSMLLIMVKETCVAEYIHLVLSVFGLFCLHLWPGAWGIVLTVLYILLGNFTFIIVQRYNRPRLIHLMQSRRTLDAKRHRAPERTKVLILSANTGEGHNSCARAIKEEYEKYGEECTVMDGLGFFSKVFSTAVVWAHVFMYRHAPRLYRFGYKQSEKHRASSFTNNSLLNMITRRASEHLYAYLLDHDYDTVICVHVFPGLLLTAVHNDVAKLGIKTCFVATDHTCSPSVEFVHTDRCFIPDQMSVDDFTRGEITRDKIVVSGIPVRSEFYAPADRVSAREKYDIPQDARHLLVMGGSMGCKAVMRVVNLMLYRLRDNEYITIVCGNNFKLERKLRKRYQSRAHIRVLGFVNGIGRLMDSADLYLTKPGGLSTTEAAVRDLPMVLIDTVSGCERYNMIFCTMNGIAVTARHMHELSMLCRRLLESPEMTDRMRAAGEGIIRVCAAEVIRNTMKEVTAEADA